MKKILIVLVLLGFITSTLSSQRSRSRDRRDSRYEEEQNFKDAIWYGLSLGNLYFFNDFSISGKFQAGYKPIERVSVGAQAKIYYDFINNIGQDFSLLSYGIGPEVRAKITEEFYAIGEYNIMSIQGATNFGAGDREGLNFPAAGIGYQQGRGPWKFGAQLLFIFSEEARDPRFLNRSVDYWIDFNYKF